MKLLQLTVTFSFVDFIGEQLCAFVSFNTLMDSRKLSSRPRLRFANLIPRLHDQQTSSRRRAISTCILNIFAGVLVIWSRQEPELCASVTRSSELSAAGASTWNSLLSELKNTSQKVGQFPDQFKTQPL